MEIYNAPGWIFFPGMSMQIGDAARELGVSIPTLKKYMPTLGLTIYRHPTTNNRYFLVSEIQELKELLPTITAAKVRAASTNGKRGYGVLRQIKRKG
jgi:hypothetical protein